ncbi:MAG: transketolase, partial [bacterium]|nr:transketolase [bacterium]
VTAVERAHGVSEKPTVIIADTIPGYGVNYMEYNFEWHGKPPKPGEESAQALAELRTLGGHIMSEHE